MNNALKSIWYKFQYTTLKICTLIFVTCKIYWNWSFFYIGIDLCIYEYIDNINTIISLYHRKMRCFKKRKCVQYCWISSLWCISCLNNIDLCYIEKKKESNKDHSNDSDNASHNEAVSQTSTVLWLTVDALTWHWHVQNWVLLIFWGFYKTLPFGTWMIIVWIFWNDVWCSMELMIILLLYELKEMCWTEWKKLCFSHCLKIWSSLLLFVLVSHLKENHCVAVHT